MDVRPDSPTFMQWVSVEVSGKNRRSLHIPPGCANAFLTLEDNTIVQYNHSELFTPGHENGIRYNDPSFGFKWPAEPKFISEKDQNHPDFKI